MEYLLSGFKWYRKLRGGEWVNYYPKPYPYMNFWAMEPFELNDMEKVVGREYYTKK